MVSILCHYTPQTDQAELTTQNIIFQVMAIFPLIFISLLPVNVKKQIAKINTLLKKHTATDK